MDVCTITNVKNLCNIFPEKFELQFNQIFRTLKDLGCDYFYFLGLDTGISYRFCTHDDWIYFYHDEKFILNDPLKRIAENSKFIGSTVIPVVCLNLTHAKSFIAVQIQ